ncbi:hypothetical protein FOZ63_030812, partial [Perkinsus olseni]
MSPGWEGGYGRTTPTVWMVDYPPLCRWRETRCWHRGQFGETTKSSWFSGGFAQIDTERLSVQISGRRRCVAKVFVKSEIFDNRLAYSVDARSLEQDDSRSAGHGEQTEDPLERTMRLQRKYLRSKIPISGPNPLPALCRVIGTAVFLFLMIFASASSYTRSTQWLGNTLCMRTVDGDAIVSNPSVYSSWIRPRGGTIIAGISLTTTLAEAAGHPTVCILVCWVIDFGPRFVK